MPYLIFAFNKNVRYQSNNLLHFDLALKIISKGSIFHFGIILIMSKNGQIFRSSSVQPTDKQTSSNVNLHQPKKIAYRNNISSYSLNQSQQSLFLGMNEDTHRTNDSFYKSAISNYQDFDPDLKFLNKSPQIYINSKVRGIK
ncbi:hypothetical protein BpHYR1_004509 [Brachionus plicatilis]|uniref:Uncharacterized protein n=1 Tax=Brachionus plicatilis TaxID=10195 RepID=A0A3M7SJH3_BRAPC|nr:hypothetical protein BpHYR1_004509 [Brachionus plicatilis]